MAALPESREQRCSRAAELGLKCMRQRTSRQLKSVLEVEERRAQRCAAVRGQKLLSIQQARYGVEERGFDGLHQINLLHQQTRHQREHQGLCGF